MPTRRTPPRRTRHVAAAATIVVTAAMALCACTGPDRGVASSSPTDAPSPPAATVDATSLQGLIDSPRVTGTLSIGADVPAVAGEQARAVSYESSGATVTGVLRTPSGSGPFPLVVVVHGSVDPESYETGRDMVPEQRALLDAGYALLVTDLRGYAGSDPADATNSLSVDPGYGWDTVLDWTMALDVVAALDIGRSGRIPGIDQDAVALLGHSLGGLLAIDAAIIAPGAADVIVAMAAPATDLGAAMTEWAEAGSEIASGAAAYGTLFSPQQHFSRATEPLVLVHGTADPVAPLAWAEATRDAWAAAGGSVELIVIEGGDHHLVPGRDEASAAIVAAIGDALG
ncbi:alpha/beta hydrolase family protein [Microbacterium caowuchunii]|nr:alpha/beta fold hydrolase [Microbacterium caowuchunii]